MTNDHADQFCVRNAFNWGPIPKMKLRGEVPLSGFCETDDFGLLFVYFHFVFRDKLFSVSDVVLEHIVSFRKDVPGALMEVERSGSGGRIRNNAVFQVDGNSNSAIVNELHFYSF